MTDEPEPAWYRELRALHEKGTPLYKMRIAVHKNHYVVVRALDEMGLSNSTRRDHPPPEHVWRAPAAEKKARNVRWKQVNDPDHWWFAAARLHEEGLSMYAIGQRLGRHQASVKYALDKQGLLPPEEPPPAGPHERRKYRR